MILYMIRSKTTGLYSKGGNDVTWSKVGKIWIGRGPLSSHFTQLTAKGRKQYRDNEAELLVVDMQGQPASTTVEQEFEAAADRARARKEDSDRRIADYRAKHGLK